MTDNEEETNKRTKPGNTERKKETKTGCWEWMEEETKCEEADPGAKRQIPKQPEWEKSWLGSKRETPSLSPSKTCLIKQSTMIQECVSWLLADTSHSAGLALRLPIWSWWPPVAGRPVYSSGLSTRQLNVFPREGHSSERQHLLPELHVKGGLRCQYTLYFLIISVLALG